MMGGLVEGTGALVRQGPQLFGFLARKSSVAGVGTRRTLAQAGQASAVERFDGVADRLVVAAQVVGNLWGVPSSGAGQENPAAAQDQGLGRAPACLQVLALGVGYGTHKDWWHHARYCNTSQNTLSEHALVGHLSWPSPFLLELKAT